MNYSSDWKNLVSCYGYGFVDDLEQYRHIVKVKAYTDMQPRTIRGLGDFRNDATNSKELDVLFDKLAVKLHSFVISEPIKSEEEFDIWHKENCDWFVSEFNSIITGKNVDQIAYGKAQKIINVSFKYIYCLKDAYKYIDKFKHCHMVLDRYTYSNGFYKKEVIPWLNKEEGKRHNAYDLTRWSNLTFAEYNTIQTNIRNFMKTTTVYVDAKGLPLTPFQAEFYIFSEYNA